MVFSIAKLFRLDKALNYFSRLENTIIVTIRFVGMVYLIGNLLSVFVFEKQLYEERLMNGEPLYTFMFFGSICYLFILTQLFWITKFLRSYLFKFIVGFSFVFSFEKFVIIVTSFHRDYLPTSWDYTCSLFYEFVGFIIVIFALFIVNLLLKRYEIKLPHGE